MSRLEDGQFLDELAAPPIDEEGELMILTEEVIVSVEGNKDRMEVELRRAGDFFSRHMLLRPVQTYEQLSNFDPVANNGSS